MKQNFTCTEWLNFANRCDTQCNMCRDLDPKSWIDIEDEGTEVN